VRGHYFPAPEARRHPPTVLRGLFELGVVEVEGPVVRGGELQVQVDLAEEGVGPVGHHHDEAVPEHDAADGVQVQHERVLPDHDVHLVRAVQPAQKSLHVADVQVRRAPPVPPPPPPHLPPQGRAPVNHWRLARPGGLHAPRGSKPCFWCVLRGPPRGPTRQTHPVHHQGGVQVMLHLLHAADGGTDAPVASPSVAQHRQPRACIVREVLKQVMVQALGQLMHAPHNHATGGGKGVGESS
jgi:hypothetical protein